MFSISLLGSPIKEIFVVNTRDDMRPIYFTNFSASPLKINFSQNKLPNEDVHGKPCKRGRPETVVCLTRLLILSGPGLLNCGVGLVQQGEAY